MAEILIKAIDATHSDSVKDRIGCYKAGMPVCVMPDGHQWGPEEGLPKFYIIKVPEVSVQKAQKLIQPQTIDLGGVLEVYRCRLWKIRIEDLPQAAKSTLKNNGALTIAVDTYAGSYDYTWDQIKNYFRNLETDLDGAEF